MNITEIKPGQHVLYTYRQLGGHSWQHTIPAVVVKVTARRVIVDVPTVAGTLHRMTVRPESLEPIRTR
jgi:hypothetical protein